MLPNTATLAWALMAMLCSRAAIAQYLFHGTSVLIEANDLMPRNATFGTASFYCFATPAGYVTFGWWMGSTPDQIQRGKVTPNPTHEQLDWFEYSTGKCNSHGVCRLKAYNYDIKNPQVPAFSEDYVIMPFQLGESDRELMFLSYFDREHGKTAVGVRRIVEGKECRQAYGTLQMLVSEKNIPIKFPLQNPCGEDLTGEIAHDAEQAVLRSHARAWDLARLQKTLDLEL